MVLTQTRSSSQGWTYSPTSEISPSSHCMNGFYILLNYKHMILIKNYIHVFVSLRFEICLHMFHRISVSIPLMFVSFRVPTN